MLAELGRWIRRVVAGVLWRVQSTARSAVRPTSLVAGLVEDASRSREELIAENALLRQQLIVAARAVGQPKFKAHERGLIVLLVSLVRQWQSAVLLIQGCRTSARERGAAAPRPPCNGRHDPPAAPATDPVTVAATATVTAGSFDAGSVQRPESTEHDASCSQSGEGADSPPPALEACVRAALAPGVLGTVRAGRRGTTTNKTHDEPLLPRKSKGKHVGELGGFGIHAGVAVSAANRLGRELLDVLSLSVKARGAASPEQLGVVHGVVAPHCPQERSESTGEGNLRGQQVDFERIIDRSWKLLAPSTRDFSKLPCPSARLSVGASSDLRRGPGQQPSTWL